MENKKGSKYGGNLFFIREMFFSFEVKIKVLGLSLSKKKRGFL